MRTGIVALEFSLPFPSCSLPVFRAWLRSLMLDALRAINFAKGRLADHQMRERREAAGLQLYRY